jgi:hypothetical protein
MTIMIPAKMTHPTHPVGSVVPRWAAPFSVLDFVGRVSVI